MSRTAARPSHPDPRPLAFPETFHDSWRHAWRFFTVDELPEVVDAPRLLTLFAPADHPRGCFHVGETRTPRAAALAALARHGDRIREEVAMTNLPLDSCRWGIRE